MNKIDIAKTVIGVTTGIGVSHIITSIVNATTPQETAIQKTATFAGRVGIAMVVSEIVQKNIDDKIDATVEWWKKINSEKASSN